MRVVQVDAQPPATEITTSNGVHVMGFAISTGKIFTLYHITVDHFRQIVAAASLRYLTNGRWERFLIFSPLKFDTGKPRVGVFFDLENAGPACPRGRVEQFFADVQQKFADAELRADVATACVGDDARQVALREIADFDQLIACVRAGDLDAIDTARSYLHGLADDPEPSVLAGAMTLLRLAAESRAMPARVA